MFRLVNVSKRYDNVAAVQGIDLTVQSGQTTVLIGPSGCGKSTILRLMTGLVRADAGVVHFRDVVLSESNILDLRRKMGYVIQDGGLFPHLNAVANITLMARYLRWSRAAIEQRLEELCDLVQLPRGALGRHPLELSGGQRQRVSLMRGLMLDPDVLLLDEPLGALDPMIRYDLQNDLRRIFQMLNKTVVMVTHDMGEAAFFADRIVLMREGRIVQDGTLRELVDSPSDGFVEKFIRAQRNPLHQMRGIS